MSDVSKKLKELRLARRMTMTDVAAAAGLSQSALSYIENGTNRPTVETLEKILKVLDMTLGDFFVGGGASEPLPVDIDRFAIDKNNHALIRMIQGMQAAGYTNEVIEEWIVSLNLTLANITDQLKKRYGIGKGEGQTRWVDEDLLPEEERGKYSEEEKRELTEKLKKKLGRT